MHDDLIKRVLEEHGGMPVDTIEQKPRRTIAQLKKEIAEMRQRCFYGMELILDRQKKGLETDQQREYWNSLAKHWIDLKEELYRAEQSYSGEGVIR